MPKSRNSNDENKYQYDEELLEGEETFIAEHRAALANREISEQHAKERRETSRWFIGIIVIVTIALTYTAQNWINQFLDLRSELSDVRERLAVLEAFHSEQHFRPVHVHPTELRCDPDQEIDSPAP